MITDDDILYASSSALSSELALLGFARAADLLVKLAGEVQTRRAADLTPPERDLVAGAIEELVELAEYGDDAFEEERTRQAAAVSKLFAASKERP